TAVYAGYDTPDRPVGVGGRVAGPIWAEFTREALKEVPPRDFPVPPGVVRLSVCASTGTVANPECPRPLEMAFLQGTEPGWSPWWYQSLLPGEGREAYLINELLFNLHRFPGWLLRR
ncbi:MAG: hypothetical protein QHH02_08990, partial [Syntrophomonadaceae bacterium]|nr:hypothetical protein [Syntrophomonadaceae bacterium]